MGQGDVAAIEGTLNELEQRIMARIGKWALAIIGTVIAIVLMASSHWFALHARVDRIEIWKAERVKPIEEYYKDQQITAERLARIEAKIEEIGAILKEK